MNGPYVNDDGDIWIGRGSAPWPAIQHEARATADEMGWGRFEDYGPVRYLGLDLAVRVSDENEAPCEVYPDSPPCSCCRTIDAHHFRAEER